MCKSTKKKKKKELECFFLAARHKEGLCESKEKEWNFSLAVGYKESVCESIEIYERFFFCCETYTRYCNWFENSEIDSEFVSWFFPWRRKGFPLKNLCSYVWLLFGIDNIGGSIIWDPTVVLELDWFSGWLFMWIKMEEKGLLWLRWSYSKRKNRLLD